MATLATTHPTLLDVANGLDPNGAVSAVVELLSEECPILEDAVFIEGNLPTGHRTVVRTGLPDVTWRKLYGGVQPSKSSRRQVTDTTGMLEAYAEVDKALADLNGNTAEWRLTEERSFVEALAQEAASAMVYSNEATAPEEITGLSPRYNSLSAENALNIVNGGGAGSDNTSMLLVVWGPNTIHGIYPKGSKAGLQVTDKGQVTIESVDGAGGRMEAYRTHYRWDLGLTVRDWRYAARVCNIDVSDLGTIANTKNLVTWMIQAAERIPNLGAGRACWYVNRTIREKLRLGILEKVASNLSWESVSGKRVMTFDDIPVKRLDSILNNEAAVS